MGIENLINNVAFPIAICVWNMYYIRELNKEAREERKELLRQAEEDRNKMIDSLTAKIDALTNLVCTITDINPIRGEVIEYGD